MNMSSNTDSQKEVLTQQRLKLHIHRGSYFLHKSERSSNTTKIETGRAVEGERVVYQSERSSNTTKIETKEHSDLMPDEIGQKEVLTQQRLKLYIIYVHS